MTTLTPMDLYAQAGAVPLYLTIPQRWAICNQKGGVGKTATAVILAQQAARRGLRTLLVDADPQGAASVWLGTVDDHRFSEALLDTALAMRPVVSQPLQPIPVAGLGHDNLALLPGSLNLVNVPPLLVRLTARSQAKDLGWKAERVMAQTLATLAPDQFDLMIVDCAPNMDELLRTALYACNRALLVCKPEFQAVYGLGAMLDTLYYIRYHAQGDLPPSLRLELRGVLPTMVRRVGRNLVSQHRAMIGQIEELAGLRGAALGGTRVLEGIPDSAVIATAAWEGVELDALVGATHPVVQAYARITDFITEEIVHG